MMPFINRHKTLVTAMLTAAGSLLLIFAAIIPVYENATSVLAKLKTRTKELESITNKVTIISKLDPTVLDERVKVIDSALPPKKDVLLYLNSIDGLSKELGLTFGGLSLSPGELTVATASATKKVAGKSNALQSLETEIKIRGGKDSVYTFLRTIEGVLPLMQIKDIKVTVLADEQYSLNLTLGMLWADPATVDVKGNVTLFGPEEDKYFTQLSEYRKYESIAAETINSEIKKDIFSSNALPQTSEIVQPSPKTSSQPSPSVIPQQ